MLTSAFNASNEQLGESMLAKVRERRLIGDHAYVRGCGVTTLGYPQLALDMLGDENLDRGAMVLASLVRAAALAGLGQRSNAVEVMERLAMTDARFQRRESLGDLGIFSFMKGALLDVHSQVAWNELPVKRLQWVRPLRFAAVISGLTNLKTYSQETMRGLNMGLDGARRSYGFTLDHWSGPEKENLRETKLTVDQALRTVRPDAVFWFGLTEESLAVMPIIEKVGIPLINCVGEKLTQSNLELAIQPERDFNGRVMARFANMHRGAKRAAVVSPYGSMKSSAMDAAFTQEFQRLGGVMTGEILKFETGEKMFSAIVQSLREQSPEVVFMSGYYQEAGHFLRELRAAGLTMPVLGWDGWDSPQLRELAGPDGVANSFMAVPFATDDPDPQLQAFIRAYVKTHVQMPGAFAAFACDSAMLLVDAIERAGSARKEDILRALKATVNFKGVTGTLSFDREGKVFRDGVVVEVLSKGTRFTTRVAP